MSDHQLARFDTPEPIEVHVENASGAVDLTATETSETTVQITGDRAEDYEVRNLGDRITVIAPRGEGLAFGSRAAADIVVVMPTGCAVEVKCGSGDLTTHGTLGATRVDNGSGDVHLESVQGSAHLQVGSGDVTVVRCAGETRIKSGSGAIRVARAEDRLIVSTGSGDVSVEESWTSVAIKTGSGDVQIGSLAGDLVHATGSGDVVVESAQPGRITAKTASGSIRIGVAAGTPVWTDIRTVSGRLDSDVPATGEPGDGQPFLEVRATTVSGNVTLQAGPTQDLIATPRRQ